MRRGSLRPRGSNVWQLRVYLGINPETGGQRYATRTVRGSRREATRELQLLVAETDNARTHAGTVTDLLERWFAAASRGWAPTTVVHTRSIIDCHLIPQLGHLPVAKVTTADIDDFYGWLLVFGGADRKGLSPGTVRRVHGVLHRALVQALRWEWIWVNPASQANPPRVRRTEIRPPSPAELASLLAAVGESNPPLCVFLRIAATTGARRGELLALRWADVDLARGAVAFTRALVVGPGGPVLAATKTDRTHSTDLDVATHQMLAAHHDAMDARARAARVALDRQAFVFSHDVDGHRPWAPNWTTKQFIAARRAADLPPFRLHDLRHFMATMMLTQAVPLAVVSQRLNHARISTTVNVYAHALPAWDRSAAEALAGLLTRSRGGVQQPSA
jgi:integrase